MYQQRAQFATPQRAGARPRSVGLVQRVGGIGVGGGPLNPYAGAGYGGGAMTPRVVQAPYGQQQMLAPQPAVVQGMGVQGMYGQQQRQPTLQQKAVCEKIDSFSNYAVYMNAVKPLFDKVAGAPGRLDFGGAQRFMREAASGLLGTNLGPQENLTQQEFIRFDFDGVGSLGFVEAAKMFRRNMLEMQKRLGGVAEVPVPFKSPAQAGYQVGKVLASGGQGSVSLAMSSRGQVALKTYSKNNENAGSIEDLRSEMEVMKEMELSPHIMACYEIFQDATNFYCVDELLSGGDLCCLREKAPQCGVRLDEVYFRNIFSQAIGALEYMHRHAMMHCDIKEPNIMFKTKDYVNPTVALIDFGMSKWSSSDGMAGGTPGYRPPETNETNVWFPRGDIFSMGVTFFQLLADKVPDEKTMRPGIFTEGAQTMEQVNQFVKTRQPPYYLIQGKYAGVMSWLPKMMDKNMRNRPKAPQLCKDPWFTAKGAAPDAVMPATGWIMPDAALMADDDDDDDATTALTYDVYPGAQVVQCFDTPRDPQPAYASPRVVQAAPQPCGFQGAAPVLNGSQKYLPGNMPPVRSARVIGGGLCR